MYLREWHGTLKSTYVKRTCGYILLSIWQQNKVHLMNMAEIKCLRHTSLRFENVL